ncbi:MAG: protein kinase, partial [Deltaproteobacteria bacterium]|nr:protein kinase [Deltaproteobacteria bacterium]
MGTVYLAEDASGARVALKVVHPHLMSSRERFAREADIGGRIRHPNVVATTGVDELEIQGKPTMALVMEYVEGQTLRSLLEELGQVPEELCRHIAVEIAKGLDAIHGKNVVHRDLKPENVLITRDHVVKIMDLGIARVTDATVGLSQTGTFIGSVKYGAPEQFQAIAADERTDLYALGLVLYELSTGKYPFGGDTVASVVRRQLHEIPRQPSLLNPQLTPFFEEVIKTLLEKDPEDRLPSATALIDLLETGEQSEWWQERARVIRANTKQPLRRVRIPRETAIYGRDDELRKLRSLYEQAKEGQGQVVLVEGEAGIGKTRLIDEFVGKLREDGEPLNFVFGGYPPGGAATSTRAFASAFADYFGDQGAGEALADMPLLVPAFDALLKGEPPPEGTEPLNKDSLQAVFVHATRSLAAESTTIVLIDDIHFAPEGGRALFAALALGLAGHKILLVGTARPGVPEDWIAQLDALRLPLQRLGPKDLARMLIDAFGSERLARDLAYQIGAKSDGNPFFTFEIIRGLREGRFIRQKSDGTWVRTQVIDDIQIPSSLIDLIEARISDLCEDESHLLEVAACCGHEFEPRLVGEVLGLGRIPALQKLARIEKTHRLIRSVGPRYLFDHHQVQEALYAGLSEPLREE